MRPLFLIIDGYSLAYRQFFGLQATSFTAPDGTPTNAIFGFTRTLLDILEKERPQYLAVSFDMGLSGRETLFSGYKGTREKMPDELEVQLSWIQKLVRAFNIPSLAVEGYEADDVIGTVTQQATTQGVDVRIITGDRDMFQLINDHVQIQMPSRNDQVDVIFDAAKFTEKYSVRVDQYIDMKALMGDASDNIPGVRGIGEKTAVKLLTEFGTLDNIYANLALIKGANQTKLAEGREMAYLSQNLATIRLNVPIQLNLPDCVAHDYRLDDVLMIFDALNFRTLRNRLLKMHTPRTTDMFGELDLSSDEPTFDEDFSAPARADHLFETVTVTTTDQLNTLVETLSKAKQIAFDTEATSVDQMAADLVGISLAVDDTRGYYIPVGHKRGEQLPMQTVIDALRPALTDPTIPKMAHNALYDVVILQRHGIDVSPVSFDTMIAEWVIDSGSKNLGLKDLTYARLTAPDGKAIMMTQISELIGTGKNQKPFSEVAIEQAAPYAAADAVMTHRLTDLLAPMLTENGLDELYQTLEMPLIPVLADMERAGVVIDTAYLADFSQRLNAMIKQVEQSIYEVGNVGHFNINSPKQLGEVLFTKLALPTKSVKKTTQGYSTDAATLEQLMDVHPIIPKIIEYRELAKLKGTYVDALPQLINARTGRVHTSFNQTGAATGRLSSSDPNLQNIPIRTELGREVRRAFIAPQGKVLLGVDYSQVELRILAHYSRDETLLDAFNRGEDIHRATAAAVFGIGIDQVTYDQRSFAKRVNFGLIYGMGAFRLARDSNLTLAEANEFIKRYFARLPRVQQYLDETKQAARSPQGLKTLFGRRRVFPVLVNNTQNHQLRAAEERAAINFPIQGSAADIIKRAMIDLRGALKRQRLSATMILQVHDELVLEVPENEVEETRALVVDVMEQAYLLDPRLRANAEVGVNWRDME